MADTDFCHQDLEASKANICRNNCIVILLLCLFLGVEPYQLEVEGWTPISKFISPDLPVDLRPFYRGPFITTVPEKETWQVEFFDLLLSRSLVN